MTGGLECSTWYDFRPPVPTSVFLPAFCEFFAQHQALRASPAMGSSQALSAQLLHLLHLLPASFTVSVFVRWITMSHWFHTTRCPRTILIPQRHPASARALSLSLLLGLIRLPVLLRRRFATPAQAAPEQQAQPAQAAPASPADEQKKPDKPGVGMKLTSGTLNISEGGTVF